MQFHPPGKDCKNKRREMREDDKGKNRGGKLRRVFCYSDEKFRHADWMIMSLEKCENEPAMPIDFEQSLRAEQPRRVVMTFRRVSYSIPRNFLSSNPLNPRKRVFLSPAPRWDHFRSSSSSSHLRRKLCGFSQKYAIIVTSCCRRNGRNPFRQALSNLPAILFESCHSRYTGWRKSRPRWISMAISAYTYNSLSRDTLKKIENFKNVWHCKIK